MTPTPSVEPAQAPESPSLCRSGDEPAFELKFLLDAEQARQAERWAREHLLPDPHADPLTGAYHTVSLYLDTLELDVFRRSPGYKRRKFRVRRYGLGPLTFLERKSKTGDRVKKRRSAVPGDELALLAGDPPPETWAGHWFSRKILKRRLLPACRIAYDRRAFGLTTPDGPLRLTLDSGLRGAPADQWGVEPVDGVPLLADRVILELKFRAGLPMAFKELVCDLGLNPASVSKYRLFREAWANA